MRFEPIRYLDWARRRFDQSPPKYNLAASGMEAASPAEAGIDLSALSIAGNNAYGHPGLRRVIGELHRVGPERVLIATGTTMANFLVQASVLREGDTVLCEWPAYEPLWRSIDTLGARVKFFRRDEARGFAPDIAAIAEGFAQGARLCVLSDLHNPSAALLDREALREVGRLAARHDGWVHVDEVYLSSVFDQDVESALTLGERFIVTGSLTKTYGLGGLRAGWAIGPKWLVDRANDIFAHLGGNAPVIADEAALQAIAHLPRLRARAAQRREQNWPLVQAFARERGLLTVLPAGAFIVWLKLPNGLDSDAFVDHLHRTEDTLVAPGSFFGAADRIRLGFSLNGEVVAEGLRRIGHALDTMP
jgi:aspartate/methionine/tyrosine aminotransferase